MAPLSFLAAFSATFAFVAASALPQRSSLAFPFFDTAPGTGCNVSALNPNLPTNQTVLTIPAGQKPKYIALGVGVQNYTCGAAGTFTSVGAVAELFDISCLTKANILPPATVTSDAVTIWDALKSVNTFELIDALEGSPFVLGQHFFVTSPSGTGLSPFFDFRSGLLKGDPNGFFLAAKSGDLPAPTGSQDVDWLELTNVEGDLAKTIFRIYTKLGQPASSCTAGQTASIKYTAEYWFYA